MLTRGPGLTRWDDLPEGIRAAWEASTRAVAKAICLATLAPLRELIEEIRSSAEEA
ncbi:hypothetical protein [Deinococcus sp. S9]|uniref:hypothetical protein n=1 Tax=Deinococcus sp. S9 TaxID=2545754 RepID=UPI0014043FE4|nr:hypothetical protein [Deinococcus sp. S9]